MVINRKGVKIGIVGFCIIIKGCNEDCTTIKVWQLHPTRKRKPSKLQKHWHPGYLFLIVITKT